MARKQQETITKIQTDWANNDVIQVPTKTHSLGALSKTLEEVAALKGVDKMLLDFPLINTRVLFSAEECAKTNLVRKILFLNATLGAMHSQMIVAKKEAKVDDQAAVPVKDVLNAMRDKGILFND
mgnify:CR=1 FL=1